MTRRQNAVLLLLFVLLAAVALWLQFGLLARPADAGGGGVEKDEPDYTIENFVSTGMDESGKKYRVIAEHLAHYPLGERALLRRPHIIQYRTGGAPRHIYAESGWLYDARAEALLSGNVRVVESQDGDPDRAPAVATGKTMTIRLKGDGSRN